MRNSLTIESKSIVKRRISEWAWSRVLPAALLAFAVGCPLSLSAEPSDGASACKQHLIDIDGKPFEGDIRAFLEIVSDRLKKQTEVLEEEYNRLSKLCSEDSAGQDIYCTQLESDSKKILERLESLQKVVTDLEQAEKGNYFDTGRELRGFLSDKAEVFGLRDFCRAGHAFDNIHSWLVAYIPSDSSNELHKKLQKLDQEKGLKDDLYFGPIRNSGQKWKLAWEEAFRRSKPSTKIIEKPECYPHQHPWEKSESGKEVELNYVFPLYRTYLMLHSLEEWTKCWLKSENQTGAKEESQPEAEPPPALEPEEMGKEEQLVKTHAPERKLQADGSGTPRPDESRASKKGGLENEDLIDIVSESNAPAGVYAGEDDISAQPAVQPKAPTAGKGGTSWWGTWVILFIFVIGIILLVYWLMGVFRNLEERVDSMQARLLKVSVGGQNAGDHAAVQANRPVVKDQSFDAFAAPGPTAAEIDSKLSNLEQRLSGVLRPIEKKSAEQNAALENLHRRLSNQEKYMTGARTYLLGKLNDMKSQGSGGNWLVDYVRDTASPLTDSARAVKSSLAFLRANGVSQMSMTQVRPMFGSFASALDSYFLGTDSSTRSGGSDDSESSQSTVFPLLIEIVEQMRRTEQGKSQLAAQAGTFKPDHYKVFEFAKWGVAELIRADKNEQVLAEFVEKLQPVVKLAGFTLLYPRAEEFFDDNYHKVVSEEASGGIGYGRVVKTVAPGLIDENDYLVEKAGIIYSKD